MGRIIVGEWLRCISCYRPLPNPKIGIFGGLGLYPKMALFTRTWSLPHAIITHRQNTANLALCSKACYNQNKPMETPS
jgi:hypothetical protein